MYFIIISLGMDTKMRVLGISSYAVLPREGSNGRAGAQPSHASHRMESRHLGGVPSAHQSTTRPFPKTFRVPLARPSEIC